MTKLKFLSKKSRKILSFFLTIALFLNVIPMVVVGDTANTVTITIEDQYGNAVDVPQSGIVVTKKLGTTRMTLTQAGTGIYKFERIKRDSYTIAINTDGYEAYVGTINKNTTNVVVELTATAPPPDEFVTFRVFYIADGIMPDDYAGAGDAADYGPSRNDTPLTTIDVNITKLKTYTDTVKFVENSSSNYWEFVPIGSPTDGDLTAEKAFWASVLECTTEESIEAFEETGLLDSFLLYCLKYQRNGTYHADGALDVLPPVYVVELYQNDVYFGGGLTDTAADSKFLTAYDILDQYEAHLKQTITWVEDENGRPKLNDEGRYTGTYVDPSTNKIHNIEVFQTNTQNTQSIEGSEIPYTKQTDTYYLAQYNMAVDNGVEIQYLITYTDGIDSLVIFNEHEYAAKKGEVVPAYTGVTIREDHIFVGWYLEKDGVVYSDAQIADMTVTSDMTFHAVWEVIPVYTATLEVILNGSYDAVNNEHIGTLVDITKVLGANATLYTSCDGAEFIPLERKEEGVYTAVLENGEYRFYYSLDGGKTFTLTDPQLLVMGNTDRTKHLFYNSVQYNLNGGTVSAELPYEYYIINSPVSVTKQVPVKEGYLFVGWKDQNGNLYKSGESLTAAINSKYILTAQYEEVFDVYVNIKINHISVDGIHNNDNGKHDMFFTVDTREIGSNSDYIEIYSKTMDWDGISEYDGVYYEAYHIIQNDADYTRYNAVLPILENVPKNREYTFTTHKSGYDILSVTQEIDENGDLKIYAELIFNPNNFDLHYTVELDEAAKKLPDHLKPVAVNVKVTAWHDSPYVDGEQVDWYTVSKHKDTYQRVALDANGMGIGTFPVVIATTDGYSVYYYRIEVVSYELADGRIIEANNINGDNVIYETPLKRYSAKIVVDGGIDPVLGDSDALTGVWYGDTTDDGIDNPTQQGTLKAIVSIRVYDITFIPDGGTLNGSKDNTVLTEQIEIPDLSGFVPVRDGGYVFDGWYQVDENGVMTEVKFNTGDVLTSDVTLIAKWKEPLTVSGTITAGASYEQENKDGNITIQTLHERDRLKEVIVLLQKVFDNGYCKTIAQQTVYFDYTKNEYYFTNPQGIVLTVGVGEYAFTNLPDDGSQYRIEILTANYTSAYQNEPESVDNLKAYLTYTESDFLAVNGNANQELTVNAHLHFTPPVFDLEFKVDSSAISEEFRPDGAEILITYDVDAAITDSSLWTVISQQIFDDGYKGYDVELSNGIGNGIYPVWKHHYGGSVLYDYGIRVHSILANGTRYEYIENDYFTVVYQAPAHFVDNSEGMKQNRLLVAYLIPKTYSIRYETNGGILTGIHTHTHTWSFETQLENVVPTREGFLFAGWYLDEALTQPRTSNVIDASVAEDTVFYAKWIQLQDIVHLEVIVDHTDIGSEAGVASNYNKNIGVQLVRKNRGSSDSFVQVAGEYKEYDSSYWHTRGDDMEQDVLIVPNAFKNLSSLYDYNLEVELDGYVVDSENSSVVTEENEDGSTSHYVTVYLKFSPDRFDLKFDVEMASDAYKSMYVASASVKISCWYDPYAEEETLSWHPITQHIDSVIEVSIDPETGKGSGSYSVWNWFNKEENIPYYYRIEVTALTLKDGTVIPLEEKIADTFFAANGYNATVYTDSDCIVPDANNTTLSGICGVVNDDGTCGQVGNIKAVIDLQKITFHTNNSDSVSDDIFKTHYIANGSSVSSFYDIPEFDNKLHNKYIFKGWYLDPVDESEPFEFGAVYSDNTDVYAHWIEVTDVTQENDGAALPEDWNGNYQGYGIAGVQINAPEKDSANHYGTAGSGMRFIAVLSEALYKEINSIGGNESGAEYGFVFAKLSRLNTENATELLYKGKNVNGVNTTSEYYYASNLKCNGVPDYYNGDTYRIYSGVITYKSAAAQGSAALEEAYNENVVARAYIRYYDGNGLLRTYHSNYTGDSVCGGFSMNYNTANVMETIR